jgi:hypothetical protein
VELEAIGSQAGCEPVKKKGVPRERDWEGDGWSGGRSDGTPQIARLLGASEQDESTEVPLLHLKSLYCFALLCFALLCFRSPAAPQALDLTCVGCCTPYIRLGLILIWPSSGPPPARASSSAGPVESRASVSATLPEPFGCPKAERPPTPPPQDGC